MSVTNFENAEGELISQVDIDSEKYSAKSSRCSCINCDPLGCFEKRKKTVQDRCKCNICRDRRKSSTLPNENSQENRGLESVTKKIIREVVTRETIESLKRVTETMYEFGTNENLGMITDRQSDVNDKKVILRPTKSQISIKVECYKQRPIGQVPGTDVSQPHKENNTVTKLSAQVMNVPYEDLHESVKSSDEMTVQNPLSKLNIFRRIKEIYEACSCKVCECISSKPRDLREDFCNCQPCQCEDCVKIRKKIEEKIRRIPHSGCPCIRCDRKDCRGIAKNTSEPQACDCSGNESIQYPQNLTKHCKCEPCQCINCKLLDFRTSKTVRLGQVDAFIQREMCQCSLCECIECKHIYSRTNPTIMCTQATDMNKNLTNCRCHNCRSEQCQFGDVEKCKCEKYKIGMRKPFDKNCNDYDIRTVILDNTSPFNQQIECNLTKQDTVSLFASLKNNYPSNPCNRGICKCAECECIVCSAKDNSLENYRAHNIMSMHNDIKKSKSIMNACKCSPCECEICSKKGKQENNVSLASKCRCDVCDCLNCDNTLIATASFPSSSTSQQSYNTRGRYPAKPITNTAVNKNCRCSPCDCSHCKKLYSCSSSVKFYPNGKSVEKKTQRLRKVMLITPSTSESRLKSQKKYVQSVSSTSLNSKQSIDGVFNQDLSTCHAFSHNYAPMSHSRSINKNHVCQLYEDSKEYKFVSDDDINREMFFKLNNPVLDTESFKSAEETPVLDYSNNLTQFNFETHKIVNSNQDKPIDVKSKSFFKIIHDQPENITSNDSDASLPIYWTYNGTSYPSSFCRNINFAGKMTRSILQDNLNDRLTNTQWPKYKQDYFNEKDKSKSSSIFTEYVKEPYCVQSHKCDKEHVDPWQESDNYSDTYGSSAKDLKSQEYKQPIIKPSDISIDYERATRVLWEAKAFSSKLIKMLDSFETANRQFESASQKFKVLHESLLDINESELDKSTNLKTKPKPIFEDTFEIATEVYHEDKESAGKSVKNENEAEREYEQCTTKSEDSCDITQCTDEEKYESIDTPETKHTNKDIENTNYTNKKGNEINTVNDNNEVQRSSSQLKIEKCHEIEIMPASKSSLGRVCDSTTFISNETDILNKEENETENTNVTRIREKPTIATVMHKLDSVLGNIKIVDTAVATDDGDKSVLGTIEQEDKKPWQIFKKNLYLNARLSDGKKIIKSPALELDIKDAIQAISLKTTNKKCINVIPRPNEALANLRSEVNDLLNMPLLQNNYQFKNRTEPDVHLLQRKKIDLEVKSLSSTASSQTYDRIIERADKEVYFNVNSEANKTSCDQLKASFIGLRRVSDHTVLVKWNVPKRIADVQGYELLVDGRAVQKIFSPTRRMAVVTCLPHAARVLLTIRTIATADCGHAPASSIVYRPRMK